MKTNLLRAMLFTPGPNKSWGLPLLLWGLPGVAKTAILRSLARGYGIPLEWLSPAARGEGAFGVTPVPLDDCMTYPRPDWTDKFKEEERGIVFLDEINLAAPHYAGALLGLLSERVIGSHQLPPGVRMFAAANPIEIAAASGGWDLSAPAANRVGHLNWGCPRVEEWAAWLLGDDENDEIVVDCAAEEAHVLRLWPDAWAAARGVVAGFLSAHATHLHAMPAASDGKNVGKAWPSPRTWEYATRAWASAIVHKLTDAERDELVGAFVGDASAGEMLAWYAEASLPNSADLLDGKVQWAHRPARLDVTMAVFGSAAKVCVGTADETLRKKRAGAMWSLLEQAVDSSPDTIVTPAKTLVKAKLLTKSVKLLNKLGPLLQAADVRPDA